MSARTVNIAGLVPVEDPFYRYQMPPLDCHHEKKWTVVDNLRTVTNALHRQESEVLKYFGVALCTQTATRQGRSCIKGRYTASTLQDRLRYYIEQFVLCGQCKKPETAYRVKKSELVFQRCFACGYKTPLDMDHKVSAFVIAQYKVSKEKQHGAKKPENSSKGALKAATKVKNKEESTSKSKTSSCIKKEGNRKIEKEGMEEPGTAPAKHKRQNDCKEIMDDTAAFEEAVEAVCLYWQSSISPPTTNEIVRFVKREQKSSVLLARERIRILLTAAARSSPNSWWLRNEILDATNHLVCASDLMRRYMELYVIECLIAILSTLPSKKSTRFVFLLNQFYEHDVLDEDTILQWFNEDTLMVLPTVSRTDHQEMKMAARPFVEWLETAETESDSEEN